MATPDENPLPDVGRAENDKSREHLFRPAAYQEWHDSAEFLEWLKLARHKHYENYGPN